MNKKLVLAGLTLALVVGAGGSTFNVMQANAQTQTTTVVTADIKQTPPQDGSFDPSRGGHVGQNGSREEVLTGDTAEKVKAAALKAVPGGTIERVETEADGNGTYEAHMTDANGSRVTVYFDSNFNLTKNESGR